MTVNVVLVDDHDLIRGGLRRAFDAEPDFAVVGEAGSCEQARALLGEQAPGVCVIDVNLPDGNGLELAAELRKRFSNLGIVMLTMYDDDKHLFKALDVGATAFVSKSSPSPELIAAARHAATSPTAFTAANLAVAMRRRMSQPAVRLTEREREVLELLKLGLPITAIARRIYMSPSTVKTHVSKLYEKLGASNRTQAVMEAIRLGLTEAPETASAS